MQHSAVLLSSLTSLPGLAPAAVSADRPRVEEGGSDEPFAVLLAAIDAPPRGEALPSGGKVLPPGAAAANAPAADAIAGPLTLPPQAAAFEGLPTIVSPRARAASPASVGIDAALDAPGQENVPSEPFPTRAARVVDAAKGFTAGALPVDDAGRWSAISAVPLDVPPAAAISALPLADAPRTAAAGVSAAGALPSDVTSGAPPGAEPVDALPAEADVPVDLDPAERIVERAAADGAEHGSEHDAQDDGVVLRMAARAGAVTGTPDAAAPAAPVVASSAAASPPAQIDVTESQSPRGAHELGSRPGPPAELGESVAGRIRLMVDQGAGEARLRLNPPELGTIDVRIAVVDDKTFVQLTASHAVGRDALEQSLPRLRELLAAGGLDVGGASVDGGGRGASSGYAAPGERGYALSTETAGDALGPPPSPGDPPRRSSSRVDLYA